MTSAEVLFRKGAAAHRAGDLSAAVEHYRAVLKIHPDLVAARDNLCLALLAQGDYASGFSMYDVRFSRSPGRAVVRPSPSYPEWRGEPISGKSILVWPEQGYGDQIQFARFAKTLAERGAAVTLLAPPPLYRLFAHALPIRVVEASGPTRVPKHDFWAMVGSLPARLGATVETLPTAPYLGGPGPGRGIGVVWRGDPRHHNDAQRSLSPELSKRLLSLPGAVSLHPEDTAAKDFAETAVIIAGLDLVISVDTSVAHLAGAMGKPVWVMLPAINTDWRWMVGRHDSPWYPSMRLFRQQPGEPWAAVVDRVSRAARARLQPAR